MDKPEPEPKEVPFEIPSNVRSIEPEELLAIFENRLTLIEGHASKARQRVFDELTKVILQFSKIASSQAKEIKPLKDEILRLRVLCKSHNIDPIPPKPKKPNRAERRKQARVEKKEQKKRRK